MRLYSLPVAADVARAARNREDGWVIGFHPVARMNPYQGLMYCRAHVSGFAPVPLARRSDLSSLEVAIGMGVKSLLHIHWTSDVLADSDSYEDAAARAKEFIEELWSLRDKGIRIVWSVHNVLPHRCPYPKIEAELRSELADLADVVHVMAATTVEETSPFYSLPKEKIIEVPHPSYVGAYPTFIDKAQARSELGYEASDLLIGAIGSIQAYKGLTELAMATKAQMRSDPDLRVIVAGIVGNDGDSRDVVTELREANHIDLIARRLTDREVATVVTALDISVLPYRASLNSGAALLALSFGVPILAPLQGSFRQLIDQGLGIGYDIEASHGLSDALGDMRGFLASFDGSRALEVTADLAAPSVSALFFRKLRSRIAVDR